MKWYKNRLETALTAVGFSLMLTSNGVLANNFKIDVSDDDIAIEASDASLTELLQELERLTGIPVKFVAETTERVTLNVGMTDIENAISKITPNHMIVHENQDGKKVISELIIIPAESGVASGGSGAAFLPNGQPAPAIESPVPTVPPSPNDPNRPSVQPAVQPQPVDQQQPQQEPMPATGTQQVN